MTTGRLAFLTARAWLDEDGDHVWTSHDCNGAEVVTMLPWPTWHAKDGRVHPSVSCDTCGAHYMATIETP